MKNNFIKGTCKVCKTNLCIQCNHNNVSYCYKCYNYDFEQKCKINFLCCLVKNFDLNHDLLIRKSG